MCRWSGNTGLSQVIFVYVVLSRDILVYQQVRRARGYLDSLCMDGAEVAVNCEWNVRSCPTCWCPDGDLARTDKTYKFRRVAEVLSKLDAARDELLDEDDDTLPGLLRSAYVIGCSPATHGCLFPSLSCSCLAQRTNRTNGI